MNKTARIIRGHMLASAALLAVTAASPAFAQVQEELPPPQADESAADEDIAEIVVTAQKREEAILDIPQSVTVVSGDTLERQQATNFEDYAALIPGLSFNQSNPGNTTIVLRGVNTGGVSPIVAVYLDETPFGSSSGLVNGSILAGDFDTFDVARLEVLRGPQGTLYGASSLGGVVKFVTNLPQIGTFAARGRAGIEFVDGGEMGWNTTGMVNVPFGDIGAFRGTGFYRRDGGWIDAVEGDVMLGTAPSQGGRNLNDTDVYGGRGSLLLHPVDRLTVRLTAHTQTIKTNQSSTVQVLQDSYDLPDGDFRQVSFIPTDRTTRYRLYNGTVEYDFGFASLLSSTSYGKLNQSFNSDLTASYGPIVTFLVGDFVDRPLGLNQDQRTNHSKFTQEIRLVSPSSDTFEWLLGAYYTREKGLIFQDINAYDLPEAELAADLPNMGIATLPSRYREYAGFANATYHITDRFDITAGGRLSKNKQRADQVLGGLLFGGGPITYPRSESSESVFTYSVSPRFDVNENTAVYGRIATGYRPGGPNVIPAGAPADTPATYDADRLTSFEAGLKTDLGRQLSLDISAYVLKWKDIQLLAVINDVGLNANGGKATSKGLEANLLARPMRGLQVGINGAVIDAELDEDTPAIVGGIKGDQLPWTAGASLGVTADYEWGLGAGTTAFVGSSLRWLARQHADFDAAYRLENGHQRRIPSYARLDLRAGVEFGRFSVEAFAQNVTNTRGLTSAAYPEVLVFGGPALPNGALSAAVLRPRTIGFTVGASY